MVLILCILSGDGCFGLNDPLRQYFSLYRAVTQREGDRKEYCLMKLYICSKFHENIDAHFKVKSGYNSETNTFKGALFG